MNKKRPLEGRDALWFSIREQRDEFTYRSILTAKVSLDQSRDYIQALLAANILKELPAGEAGDRRFRLADDRGIHAPRVRQDGTFLPRSKSDAMWTGMKILQSFTSKDLQVACSTEDVPITLNYAKDYCINLEKAGYLIIERPAKPGRLARYRFVRFTGPKPPQIKRTAVIYDPNLREIVWREDAE